MKKLTLILSALFMFGVVSTQSATAHQGKSSRTVVATTNLSLRSCPSTHCHRKGKIRKHGKVKVISCGRSWCKIVYKGRVGFSAKSYLRAVKHSHRRKGHGRRSGYGKHHGNSGNGFYFHIRLK